MAIRLRLPQKAVYFAPKGADTFGRPTFTAPVEYPARWEQGNSETIGPDGINTLSTTTVYLAQTVLVGGCLFQGALKDAAGISLTDPKADRRVREIINAGTVPNLNGAQQLATAKLV